MKRLTAVLSAGLLFINVLVVKAENIVDLENIAGKKIDKDIQDIIFYENDKTNTDKKYIINKNDIEFYNLNGNLKNKYAISTSEKNKRITYRKTKNEDFIGINTIVYKNNKNEIKEGIFSVLNDNGEILWEIKHKDDIYKITPFPNGKNAIAELNPENGKAPLLLYDSDGLSGKIEKPTRSYKYDISSDGNFIAVTMNIGGKEKREDRKGYLSLFSNKGSKIWTKEVGITANEVVISNNNKFIAVNTTEKKDRWIQFINVFNSEGILLWRKELSDGLASFMFSNDGKLIFTQWKLFDAKNGRLIFEYKISKDDYLQIKNISATLDFNKIVVSGYKAKISSANRNVSKLSDFVIVFSKNGEKIFEKYFPADYLNTGTFEYSYKTKISLNGEEVSLKTKDGIKIINNFRGSK